jgi:hypothetical protein
VRRNPHSSLKPGLCVKPPTFVGGFFFSLAVSYNYAMTVFHQFNQQERPMYEPYQNRWIAIVAEQIIGVGLDAEQAYRAAKKARPKARPQIFLSMPKVGCTVSLQK